MAKFSRVDFWNERYKSSPTGCEEWYQGYRSLRHLFNTESFSAHGRGNGVGRTHRDADPATMDTIPEQKEPSPSSVPLAMPFPDPRDARVLILGCGNSAFSEHMREDAWTGKMVNIDFSSVVIEQQKEKYRHYSPKIEFICHDIREGLPFEDGSFDLIVSKASFDAILCSASPIGDARRTIQEVVRCLAPGHGIFVLVTSGNPDSRLLYLEHANQLYHYWDSVRHHAVQRPGSPKSKPKLDYVYISRRKRIIPSTPVTSVPAAEQSEGVENRNQTESGMAREETKIQSGSEQDTAKRMS